MRSLPQIFPCDGRPIVPRTTSPFVGPKAFGVEDELRFFGRDEELAELLSLVMANPLTLLYSESGAGKTSLINAKIIPGLAHKECDIIGPVRVSGDFSADLIDSVDGNVYVASALILMKRDDEDISREELARMSLAGYLKRRHRPPTPHAIRPPRVILFDQFEELFTTRHDRWHDRQNFFRQLGEALDADPRLRVLIAMREEFVASIDSYAMELPEPPRTRFRLERLRRDTALQAVNGPLIGTKIEFGPGVDELLVDKLLVMKTNEGTVAPGEFVEPLYLQIVLDRIWKAFPDDRGVIDSKFVESNADIDEALAAYYADCLTDVADATQHSEGELRSRIQKNFITSDGYRSLVYRKTDESAGDLPRDVVAALQRRYLIRAEVRGITCWYELTHDRLIPAILSSNAMWREHSALGHYTVASLEMMASEWDTSKSEALLLRGNDFLKVNAVLKHEGEATGTSETIRRFVVASEIARERRRAARLRLQLVFGTVLAFVFGVVAWRQFYLIAERDRATSHERADMVRTLKAKKALPPEILAWSIRAHADSKYGRENTALLRDSLKSLGAAQWLYVEKPDVQNALFSANDDDLLTISDNRLAVWNRHTGVLESEISSPPHRVWVEAFFTRSGKWIMARSAPDPGERKRDFIPLTDTDELRCDVIDWKKARSGDASKFSVVPEMADLRRHVDVSVSPLDRYIALTYAPEFETSSRANWVQIFEANPSRPGTIKKLALIKTSTEIRWVSLSPSGSRFIAHDNHSVSIWDIARRIPIGTLEQTVNRDAIPIVKWASDDKLVFGFRDAKHFRPTLVRIFADHLEPTKLDIPNMFRDAQFSADGKRLIAKADDGVQQNRTTKVCEIDEHGHVTRKLEDEKPFSYAHYRNYFPGLKKGTEGFITFIRCNAKGEGCEVSVERSGRKRSVKMPGLRFQDLTSISSDGRHLLGVTAGVARIWTIDKPTQDIDSLDEKQLVAESCKRLVNQREFGKITHIDGGCAEAPSLLAGMPLAFGR